MQDPNYTPGKGSDDSLEQGGNTPGDRGDSSGSSEVAGEPATASHSDKVEPETASRPPADTVQDPNDKPGKGSDDSLEQGDDTGVAGVGSSGDGGDSSGSSEVAGEPATASHSDKTEPETASRPPANIAQHPSEKPAGSR